MTRTSIQMLIVFTSLSLISAMPFIDADTGLEKLHDDDDYDMPSRPESLTSDLESKLADVDLNMLSTGDLLDILAEFKQLQDIGQQRVGDVGSSGTFGGSRGKRLELRRVPYGRQFRGVHGLLPSRVFVASRGKRERDEDMSSYYGQLGFPQVKRRRGFTALRGR